MKKYVKGYCLTPSKVWVGLLVRSINRRYLVLLMTDHEPAKEAAAWARWSCWVWFPPQHPRGSEVQGAVPSPWTLFFSRISDLPLSPFPQDAHRSWSSFILPESSMVKSHHPQSTKVVILSGTASPRWVSLLGVNGTLLANTLETFLCYRRISLLSVEDEKWKEGRNDKDWEVRYPLYGTSLLPTYQIDRKGIQVAVKKKKRNGWDSVFQTTSCSLKIKLLIFRMPAELFRLCPCSFNNGLGL